MKQKIRKIVEILCKLALCYVIGVFLFIVLILTGYIFGADPIYDKCMERCVLPDKSNYTECANSTCDFPI
jgi:hypothetical protein